jgi:hypothetical protein
MNGIRTQKRRTVLDLAALRVRPISWMSMYGANKMILNEIRTMGKEKDVNIYGMGKLETIWAIKRAEKNIECYGTQRVEYCHQESCLWKNECLFLIYNSKAQPRWLYALHGIIKRISICVW